jgi:hypothetical protein
MCAQDIAENSEEPQDDFNCAPSLQPSLCEAYVISKYYHLSLFKTCLTRFCNDKNVKQFLNLCIMKKYGGERTAASIFNFGSTRRCAVTAELWPP